MSELRPTIVGIDPGFASLGICRLALERGLDGRASATLLDVAVLETKKSAKKHAVYASDDNVRRVFELHDQLMAYLTACGDPPVAIAAEAMSFARNASASGKVCLAWGVLGSIAHVHHIPLLQTLPQEVKQRVAGKRNASKDEVQAALRGLYGAPLVERMAGIARSKHEHAADALAVAHTALTSPTIQAVVKALR